MSGQSNKNTVNKLSRQDSQLSDFWRRFRRNRGALIGAVIVDDNDFKIRVIDLQTADDRTDDVFFLVESRHQHGHKRGKAGVAGRRHTAFAPEKENYARYHPQRAAEYRVPRKKDERGEIHRVPLNRFHDCRDIDHGAPLS